MKMKDKDNKIQMSKGTRIIGVFAVACLLIPGLVTGEFNFFMRSSLNPSVINLSDNPSLYYMTVVVLLIGLLVFVLPNKK